MNVAGLSCRFELKKASRPKYAKEQNAVRLEFVNGEYNMFYVNGAVVWPEAMQLGFAIVAAQELVSGSIVVLEDFEFQSIRTEVVGYAGWRRREVGFGKWALDMMDMLHCDRYFWGGKKTDEIHRKNRQDVNRNPQVKFRPRFVRVPYAKESQNVDKIIYDLERRGVLYGKANSKLHEKMQLARADIKDETGLVGLNALRNLVGGLKKHPWHNTVKDVPEPYMIKIKLG